MRHLTATSLDSEAELLEKYPQAVGNVAVVRGMASGGGVVVHGVDARTVGRVKAVRKRRGEVVPGPVEEGGKEEEEGEEEEGRKGLGGRGVVGFDVITFMFPHIGGKSTHLDRQVRGNQRTLSFIFPASHHSINHATRTPPIILHIGKTPPVSPWRNCRHTVRRQAVRSLGY